MNKLNITISILYCLLFSALNLSAQCPQTNETVKLDGQAEVDAFIANNPTCEYIEELELTGDVTDVSGFSTLKSLDYLYFVDCPLLTDISAFGNVDSIFNHLGFYDAVGFPDLCGLDNLKFIGQDLRLEETSGLKALTGLEQVNTIGDDITIFENVDLERLDGIENVVSFGDDINESHYVQITSNPKLDDCCGIQNLYALFPMENWEVSNNAVNCNSIMEVENDDCTMPSASCIINTKDHFTERVIVSPNPSSDFVNIENASGYLITDVELMSLDGRLISKLKIADKQLDVSNVNAGIYFLKMKFDGEIRMTRIVIAK